MKTSRISYAEYWLPIAGFLAVFSLLLLFQSQRESNVENLASNWGLPAMQDVELLLGKKQMIQLRTRRAVALHDGILLEHDSSWVGATLREGRQAWPVRIRLKGDWTDHLEGNKWSFRVEMKDSAAWRRMRVFSFQSSATRGHLSEWVFHQVLQQEGILTPAYDFISLKLNGASMGIYAVEEHFSKELLERQRRREGPMLKLDESGMWDARAEALRDSNFPYLQNAFYESASTLPFSPKRTLRDTTLRTEFRIANQLLAQYRNCNGPPAELFNLEVVARQYALTDLFAAYHGMIWHNRRFYYNPVMSKLEPVMFDAFSGEENDHYIDGPIWGYKVDGYAADAGYRDLPSVLFFRDDEFVKAYYQSLIRFTESSYLDSIFSRIRTALVQREIFIRREYWSYRYDQSQVRENAKQILKYLADSLLDSHLIITEDNSDDGNAYILIQNENPLPVELWVEGNEETTLQLLPPASLSAVPCWATFRKITNLKIGYRLPGTKSLNWLKVDLRR